MEITRTYRGMQATWNGEFLKGRRKSLGLTTDELAQKVGCSRPLISMWQQNKSAPLGHLLVLLGIALNNHPNDFYKIEEIHIQEKESVNV